RRSREEGRARGGARAQLLRRRAGLKRLGQRAPRLGEAGTVPPRARPCPREFGKSVDQRRVIHRDASSDAGLVRRARSGNAAISFSRAAYAPTPDGRQVKRALIALSRASLDAGFRNVGARAMGGVAARPATAKEGAARMESPEQPERTGHTRR